MCRTARFSKFLSVESVDVMTALKQLSTLKMKFQLRAVRNAGKEFEMPTVLQSRENLERKISRRKLQHFAKNAFNYCYKKKGTNIEPKTKEIEENKTTDLLQILALSSLELTAPASDVLLRNRTPTWIQLSGHNDSFCPSGPGTILKKISDSKEVKAYEALMKDAVAEMVPRFYKKVEVNGQTYIEIQDLLHNFKCPAIMDIKMGTRTFLESEAQNTEARRDLFEKMVKINPDALSIEEKKSKAVTKLKYMQFRENLSSTSSLGFRIEGYKEMEEPPTTDLKMIKTFEEVSAVLKNFLQGHENIRQQVILSLCQLRSKFEKSEFFRNHEVIGSSLLVIHDGRRAGVWMIDFAKTTDLPPGVKVDHRSPWMLGNHEDGYLSGLDNLITALKNCQENVCVDCIP